MKAAGATPSMSVEDLLQFVHMHLNGGKTRHGRRILSSASVRAMQRRQIRLPKNSPRAMNAWGLGWCMGTWSGKRVIGHDGGTVGQYAFLRILPERKLAFALLTNGGDAMGLFNELCGRTFEHPGHIRAPGLPQPDRAVRIDPDRVVGRYENMTGQLDISATGEQFHLDVTPRPGMLAGTTATATPLRFLDTNTAQLVSDDIQLARTTVTFEGGSHRYPEFLGMGHRLYRRVAERLLRV
jgi:CubicO group peptidase (beta-lactamase class C family)